MPTLPGKGAVSRAAARVCTRPAFFRTPMRPRVGNGDAGTVVAAIFEPVQTFDQDFLGRPIADISHDPAHGFCRSSFATAQLVCPRWEGWEFTPLAKNGQRANLKGPNSAGP